MQRFLSAAALAVLTAIPPAGPGARAEETPAWADFTFRRVAPPAAGASRRITVQIDPAEQAAFIAARPRPGDRPAIDVAPGAAPDATGGPSGAFPWFWATMSPGVTGASPGRLEAAVAALADTASGSSVPAPRLQALQSIASEHGAAILEATIGTRVSPALALAVIGIESAGRSDAVSHKGASGLMQLMPDTAARFGVTDTTVAAENIRGGVAYLDWLMEEFGGDPLLVLAGYNAGEGAVRANGGVPPYTETRDYVPKVLAAWNVAKGLCLTPPELLSDGCVFRVGAAGL